ncbi:MAG: glycosyltransferase family 39 protein [Bryobacteraceae bacterium]|nr:glycosyltransferase family 39 protein [Bryobacteraceae bacterium]
MDFLDRLAVRIERTSSSFARLLEQRPVMAWCAFSLFYFSATAWRASRKPFWFDELVTLHLCRLPTVREVWAAFESAADAMPPLYHLLARASIAMFGEGHISLRAPAMFGVWILCLCLYLFVRSHCPAVYGWVAAVTMALAMTLNGYSQEARSYGLLMGITGLALVCWQSATGRYRRLSLLGLALSVAMAIFSHAMALIVAAALGLAELVRAGMRRKLDWPVFAALLAGASASLLLLPAGAASAAAYAGSDWSRPGLIRILTTYRFLLKPLAAPLCASLAMACLWWSLRGPNRAGPSQAPEWRMPPAETGLAVALQFLPIAAVVSAYVTGVFTPRHTLPSLAGFCIMAAYLSHSVERNGRMLAMLIVTAVVGSMALDTALRPALSAPADACKWAREVRPSPELPIVVDDAHAFLQQVHYAPKDVAHRLVFLADAARAHRATGNKSATTGILLLARWAPLHVEPPDTFLAAHRRFYLLGSEWFESWLRAHLLEAGASVRLVRMGYFGDLYLVETDH